jgi:hypothetical protein
MSASGGHQPLLYDLPRTLAFRLKRRLKNVLEEQVLERALRLGLVSEGFE